MSEHPELKRVINGIAYNTSTSLKIFEHPKQGTYEPTQHGERKSCVQLYRTRAGHFFIVMRRPSVELEGVGKREVEDMIQPQDAPTAAFWISKHCPEKLAELRDFDAADGTSSTFSIRLDTSLKRAVTVNAAMEKKSVNQYIVQSIEKTIVNRRPTLVHPASAYLDKTSGRRVLADDGQPGMDGTVGSGTPDELQQGALASFVFNFPAAWREQDLRALLCTFAAMGSAKGASNLDVKTSLNVTAWLKLQERGTATSPIQR